MSPTPLSPHPHHTLTSADGVKQVAAGVAYRDEWHLALPGQRVPGGWVARAGRRWGVGGGTRRGRRRCNGGTTSTCRMGWGGDVGGRGSGRRGGAVGAGDGRHSTRGQGGGASTGSAVEGRLGGGDEGRGRRGSGRDKGLWHLVTTEEQQQSCNGVSSREVLYVWTVGSR